MCPRLLDLEYSVAFLLGLHGNTLMLSLPVVPVEEDCEVWLGRGIFSGGLEGGPFINVEGVSPGGKMAKLMEVSMEPEELVEEDVFVKQDYLDFTDGEAAKAFIRTLVSNDQSDAVVQTFLTATRHYCQKSNLISGTEARPDHPVEVFARYYIAALLKHSELIQLAMDIENKAGEDKDQERRTPRHLPYQLTDLCKIVHDGKLKLMKVRIYTNIRMYLSLAHQQYLEVYVNVPTC